MASVRISSVDVESLTATYLKSLTKKVLAASGSDVVMASKTGESVEFKGHDFTFEGKTPSGGQINSITFSATDGTHTLEVTGLDVAAKDVYAYLAAGKDSGVEALKALLFADTDSFTGSAAGNVIETYAGNDTAYGMGGADTISGGDGDDKLYGGTSNNTNASDGVVDGADTLSGGAGNDILRGQDGKDLLSGGAGDDNLRGDRGDDLLDGGDGRDQAAYRFDDVGLTKGITFSAAKIDGSNSVKMADGLGGTDKLVSIEGVIVTGSAYADHFTGSSGKDQFSLQAGDTLEADKGDDLVFVYAGGGTVAGDGGNDTIEIEDYDYFSGGTAGGTYKLDGGSGDNDLVILNWSDVGPAITASLDSDGKLKATSGTLFSVSGKAIESLAVNGGYGDDKLTGAAGDDFLTGAVGNDTLRGGAGDDELDGGRGDDVLDGGKSGHDLYVISADSMTTAVTIDLSTITIGSGTGTVKDIFGGTDTVSHIDGVKANGSYQADTLIGSTGDDVLDAGFGADKVSGGKGDDLVLATTYGSTFVYTTNGQIEYRDGNDTYSGGNDTDGKDLDTLSYAGVRSELTIDLEKGTASSEQTGKDKISGFEKVIGGAFDDKITANDDGSIMDGAAGKDTLVGGKGHDTYVFSAVGDSTNATPDVITKFGTGDLIDLSAIDGNATLDGDQSLRVVKAFKENGSGEDRGQITIAYDKAHDQTVVSIDTNMDKHADMTIVLSGDHHTLTNSAFVFNGA